MRLFLETLLATVLAFLPGCARDEAWGIVAVIEGMVPPKSPAAVSPDGAWIVTVPTAARQVQPAVRNARTGEDLAQLTGLGDCYSARFSPDGRRVLTVGSGHNTTVKRLWDAQTGQLLHDFDYLNPLGFSPDGQLI